MDGPIFSYRTYQKKEPFVLCKDVKISRQTYIQKKGGRYASEVPNEGEHVEGNVVGRSEPSISTGVT